MKNIPLNIFGIPNNSYLFYNNYYNNDNNYYNNDNKFLNEFKIFYDKNNDDNINYKMQEYKKESIQNYCNKDDLKIIGNFKIDNKYNVFINTKAIINEYTKNEADKIKELRYIDFYLYILEKENFKNKRLPYILKNIAIITNNKEYTDTIPFFMDANFIKKYKEDIIKEIFLNQIIDDATMAKLKDKQNK